MRAAGHDGHLRDEIDVGERAATQADEPIRVEPLLEILEPMVERVTLALDGRHVQQLPLGHDRGDLGDGDDEHFVALPNRHAAAGRALYSDASYSSIAAVTRDVCSTSISACSSRSCARRSVSRSRALSTGFSR